MADLVYLLIATFKSSPTTAQSLPIARSSLLKGYELELVLTNGTIDTNPAKNLRKYLMNILIDFILKKWGVIKKRSRIGIKK